MINKHKPRRASNLDGIPLYPFVTGYGDDLLERITYAEGKPGYQKEISLLIWKSILSYPKDLCDFLVDAVCRELDINTTPRQINEVYGEDTVDDFKIMNSRPFFGNEDLIRWKAYTIRPVVKGTRCIAIKEHGETYLYSRYGIVFDGFDELVKELNDAPFDDVVFDGILCYEGADAYDMSQFDLCYRAASFLKYSKNSKLSGDCVLYIYDLINLKDYKRGVFKSPFKDRLLRIEYDFVNTEHLKAVLPMYRGVGVHNIIDKYKQAIKDGFSGIYINIDSDTYAIKGQRSFFKISKIQDADLMIVDYEVDEELKQVRTISVEYKDQVIKTAVGLSKEEREYFYIQRNKILGRIANMTFIEIRKTRDGRYALPGLAFGELKPLRSPIKYNLKEYGVVEE